MSDQDTLIERLEKALTDFWAHTRMDCLRDAIVAVKERDNLLAVLLAVLRDKPTGTAAQRERELQKRLDAKAAEIDSLRSRCETLKTEAAAQFKRDGEKAEADRRAEAAFLVLRDIELDITLADGISRGYDLQPTLAKIHDHLALPSPPEEMNVTRRLARITHDEVTRMVKAVRDLGLPIGRVVFDGSSLSVVIGGDSGEKPLAPDSQDGTVVPLLRKPKL